MRNCRNAVGFSARHRASGNQEQHPVFEGMEPLLRGSLVIAGGTAGLAIHQAVFTNPHVNHRLAQHTKFFALARVFRLLALCAFDFGGTRTGTHIHQSIVPAPSVEDDVRNEVLLAKYEGATSLPALWFRRGL